MKKAFALGAMALVFTGATTIAFAQETKPIGLSIRAGIFWPTQARAKAAGKTWFGGGVEYKLGDLKLAEAGSTLSSSYSVSVDLYQKGSWRNVPVLLNYIGRSSEGFYFFGGAGVGFARTINAVNVKKNSTAFAYQLGVGYDLNKSKMPIFLEAKYIGSSKSDLNGFGVFAGIRF